MDNNSKAKNAAKSMSSHQRILSQDDTDAVKVNHKNIESMSQNT